jgi:hypothetical protein
MGLLVPDSFIVNISDQDRPRVDRLISVLERFTAVIENVTSKQQLVLRVDLEDKPPVA